MYNIYSDEKRHSMMEKLLKNEKDIILRNQKHKLRTDKLSINYQKRIRKFIIDVRLYNLILLLYFITSDG